MGRWTLVFAQLGLLTGCAREAPSPESCLAFSYQAYGVSPQSLAFAKRQEQRDPREAAILARTQESIQALTLRCITEPFTQSLVDCVNKGGQIEYCERREELRRAEN